MSPADEWQASLETSTVAAAGAVAAEEVERVPALTLVAHPDLRRVGARATLPALASGREVELSRRTPRFALPGEVATPAPLADPHVSRRPLRLAPDVGGLRLRRGGFPGDCEVDGAPLTDERRFSGEALRRGVVILLARRVALLLHAVAPVSAPEPRSFGLVGVSDAMAEVRRQIRRLAALEMTVLLRGETGTGKELVARAIHEAGPRRGHAFVAVNMASIPPTLAAAELFGAERGAFTGAERRRRGYFRRADGGTLFLDEIGAAPGEIQDLLLRALETREVQPVGTDAPRPVDARVIAATDADLEKAVAAGAFRAPLLHRLAGWEVPLPPLRARRDDVAPLLVRFLGEELAAAGARALLDDPGPHGTPWLGPPLVARLAAADWPGNVRQLRNVARQLVASCHDREQATLSPRLEARIEADADAVTEPVAPPPAPRRRKRYRKPAEIGDGELLDALRRHRWRLRPTAEALGVSRTSLYALIDRSAAVRKASDLGRGEIESCLERLGGDVDAAVEELEVSRHGLLLRLQELGIHPDPRA